MNPVIELILKRKSVRAFEAREISCAAKDEILSATLRAPTAGNMMLYSILDVQDPAIKQTLVRTCDNQAFIAQAPWVLLFLADYQRWHDYFVMSGIEEFCERQRISMRNPEEGDMLLACCDALIAAHTAVLAAEFLGIGSCYIGDITEHYEIHRELFSLPRFVVPICLLCFGYPTREQQARAPAPRFQRNYVVFENRYRQLNREDLVEMFREREKQAFQGRDTIEGAANFGQLTYLRKFDVDYARERNRSVRAILKAWRE